jgi:hypothetical protein
MRVLPNLQKKRKTSKRRKRPGGGFPHTRKQIIKINDTRGEMPTVTTAICICADYPEWWPGALASSTTWILLGIVLASFVYTGIVIEASKTLYSVLSVFVLYFIFFLLYLLAGTFDWQRPSYASGACAGANSACTGQLFDMALNRAAFPDALLVTTVAFGLMYLYTTIRIYQRGAPIVVIVFSSAYIVLYSIWEIAGRRQNAGQFIANIVLAGVVALLAIVSSHGLYTIFPWIGIEERGGGGGGGSAAGVRTIAPVGAIPLPGTTPFNYYYHQQQHRPHVHYPR